MGWLFWKPSSNSSSGNPEPARAPDGGAVAPNRSARQQCWVARDRFFTCLDANAIVDSLRDDGAARACCGSEIAAFEGACSKAWVCLLLLLFYCFLFSASLLFFYPRSRCTGQVFQGETGDGVQP